MPQNRGTHSSFLHSIQSRDAYEKLPPGQSRAERGGDKDKAGAQPTCLNLSRATERGRAPRHRSTDADPMDDDLMGRGGGFWVGLGDVGRRTSVRGWWLSQDTQDPSLALGVDENCVGIRYREKANPRD